MAGAAIGLVVRADQDVIERQLASQQIVHAVQLAAGLIAARQAGLVGRGDQQETSGLELAQQWSDRLVHTEFLQRQRADLVLAFDSDHVQNPVPLKEYTLLHASARARTSPSCLPCRKTGGKPHLAAESSPEASQE